jgi:hypothetical protein
LIASVHNFVAPLAQIEAQRYLWSMKKFAFLALPLVGAIFAVLTELTLALGAHPWWATQVIWLGLGLGILLGVILWSLRFSRTTRLLSLVGLTLAAFATAHTGKARFAASYAEDALAGQMWYFGWIATCSFALAVLATAVWPSRQNH